MRRHPALVLTRLLSSVAPGLVPGVSAQTASGRISPGGRDLQTHPAQGSGATHAIGCAVWPRRCSLHTPTTAGRGYCVGSGLMVTGMPCQMGNLLSLI